MIPKSKYQIDDYNVIDYELKSLPDFSHPIRGSVPGSIDHDPFIACLGSAHTFGRYEKNPYPSVLEQKLNIPVMNFGLASNCPSMMLGQAEEYMRYLNKAKLVIVQVTTGRNEPNSQLKAGGEHPLTNIATGESQHSRLLYEELLAENDVEAIRQILEQVRISWIENSREFLKQIVTKKVLFWFSHRKPHYVPSFETVHRLFGGYPQLVNDSWLDPLMEYVDDYVECIYPKGDVRILKNRFTGDLHKSSGFLGEKTINKYYPSTAMHQAAAESLLDVCKKHICG